MTQSLWGDNGPLPIDHTNKDCHCTGKKCSRCNKVLCVGKFGYRDVSHRRLVSTCRKCTNNDVKRYTYGISIEEFNSIVEQSRGKCGICGIETDDLDVDHNHITGKVRGMLCTRCNTLLNGVDDPEWMAMLRPYLKKYSLPLINIALSIEG